MTVTIRLTPEEEARLVALAARTGRSKSFYVRSALREYLEDLEDAYVADEAVKDFETDGRRSRPVGEIMRELGLGEPDLAAGRAANASGNV